MEKTKSLALLFVVLLATGPVYASAAGFLQILYLAKYGYEGYSIVEWILRFGNYLIERNTEDKETSAEDIGIVGWLLENRPPLALIRLFANRQVMETFSKLIPEKQAEALKKFTKKMQCTDKDTKCNILWEFLTS